MEQLNSSKVWPYLSTAACAVAGSIVTDPKSDWYKSLDKPAWQPPGWLFPIVWTALYADIAATAMQTVHELENDGSTDEAEEYRRAHLVNLALNFGWSALFFAAKRPVLAAVEAAALAVSSWDLVRRAGSVRRQRGYRLAPYGLWCSFAAVLSTEIARRNRGR